MMGLEPEQEAFHFWFGETLQVSRRVSGSRPHSLAAGPEGQIWCTLAGQGRCLVLDPPTGKRVFDLPETHRDRGLGALAAGPDGNMWLAMAGAIVRMTPKGDCACFSLLPGDVPLELVPTPEGLLFTLERSDRIGFIRAVGKARETTGAGAWAGPAYAPRPAREKALSRAERQARHEARVRRAEARQRARAEGALAAAGAGERKQEAAPAPGPLASLAALGVYLDPGDLRHILDHHGFGRNLPGKGQFAAGHSSPAALLELLARGLAGSGAVGKVLDSAGICYTKCAAEKVGWSCPPGGGLVPADHFVVVSERTWNPGLKDYDHEVITAYPVHRNW